MAGRVDVLVAVALVKGNRGWDGLDGAFGDVGGDDVAGFFGEDGGADGEVEGGGKDGEAGEMHCGRALRGWIGLLDWVFGCGDSG